MNTHYILAPVVSPDEKKGMLTSRKYVDHVLLTINSNIKLACQMLEHTDHTIDRLNFSNSKLVALWYSTYTLGGNIQNTFPTILEKYSKIIWKKKM